MTQYQQLYTGVSRAAWGYLFVYLDLKLGNVSILPSFVGIFLFLSCVDLLEEFRRDLALLRPLGRILALWHIGSWLASWFGVTLDAYFSILPLMIRLASLYFHFQLLTDLAGLAMVYQKEDSALDRRILKWRTLHTLLLTAMALIPYPLEYAPDWQSFFLTGLAMFGVFTGFCIMAALFDLRLLFRETNDTSIPPS